MTSMRPEGTIVRGRFVELELVGVSETPWMLYGNPELPDVQCNNADGTGRYNRIVVMRPGDVYGIRGRSLDSSQRYLSPIAVDGRSVYGCDPAPMLEKAHVLQEWRGEHYIIGRDDSGDYDGDILWGWRDSHASKIVNRFVVTSGSESFGSQGGRNDLRSVGTLVMAIFRVDSTPPVVTRGVVTRGDYRIGTGRGEAVTHKQTASCHISNPCPTAAEVFFIKFMAELG